MDINPQLLAGAVGLLRPFYPDLNPEKLIKALNTEEPKTKRLLTIKEYAAEKRVCIMTINRIIKRGELNIERIGKSIRIIEEV